VKIISVEQMRELDRRTIDELGVSGATLMHRAGVGAAELVLSFFNSLHQVHRKRFVILSGKGNNAGDAFVVADYIQKHSDADVIIYSVVSIGALCGDTRFYAEKIINSVEVVSETIPQFKKGDIIIDGLLGTGVKGELREPYLTWVNLINNSGLPVASIDIPSGLNGNDGTVHGAAVKADLTITMAFPKLGFTKCNGPECCGVVKCVDIGIPGCFVNEFNSDDQDEMLFHNDITFLKRRPFDAHKYTCGKTLIIAGSYNYTGAAKLAAEGALKVGSGLVSLAVPESSGLSMPASSSIVFARIPDSGNGVFSKESAIYLNDLIKRTDSVLIGPGLTFCQETELFFKYLNFLNKKCVFDADALNIIASSINEKKTISLPPNSVMTPHQGEMNRLILALQSTQKNMHIEALAKYFHCVIVAKGVQSRIASHDGSTIFNSSGTAALASAGTGDVLAGMIAGFLAQGVPVEQASSAAVYIHGLTPEFANDGVRAFTADSILQNIPKVMRYISPFA